MLCDRHPFTYPLQHWILEIGSTYNNCKYHPVCLTPYLIRQVISIFPCNFAWKDLIRVNFIDIKWGDTRVNKWNFNMNESSIIIWFVLNLKRCELSRIFDKNRFCLNWIIICFSTIIINKQHTIAITFNSKLIQFNKKKRQWGGNFQGLQRQLLAAIPAIVRYRYGACKRKWKIDRKIYKCKRVKWYNTYFLTSNDFGKKIWLGVFDGRGKKKWWWNNDAGVGCCKQQVSCATAPNYHWRLIYGN